MVLFQKQTFKYFFLYSRAYPRTVKLHLQQFSKWKKINLLLIDILKINNILLISKFFLYQQDIHFFIKKKFIFKNRATVINNFQYTPLYSLIELVVFKDMYIFNKIIFFFYLFKPNQKIKLIKKNLTKLDVIFFKTIDKSLKNIIEIDYYTLSCFIVKLNIFASLLKLKLLFLGFQFKLYLWKKLL